MGSNGRWRIAKTPLLPLPIPRIQISFQIVQSLSPRPNLPFLFHSFILPPHFQNPPAHFVHHSTTIIPRPNHSIPSINPRQSNIPLTSSFFPIVHQKFCKIIKMCVGIASWMVAETSLKMPIFALQMKANLMNVTELRPSNYDEHRWYLKLKCSGCGEHYPQWQYANVQETHALTKGKGVCHISAKCSLCGRINTLEILTNSYAPYVMTEGAAKFQTIAKFDCRGIEPVGFDPRIGWRCVGTESGTSFEDVDLNEMEWADYDEKAGEPVEINEMTFQFVPIRE